MKLVTRGWFAGAVLALAIAGVAGAGVREEHVTGGVLDLAWQPGLLLPNGDPLPNVMHAAILSAADPAYANPSGDHTVAVATNSFAPDSGGVILTCTDPAGYSNYTWQGWMFTGDGNTRRGLVVRADAANAFQSCYQFVIQSGLFQLNFRKLINQAPTTLGTWFADGSLLPVVTTNTWHQLKVEAIGNAFRCWWDNIELTAPPFVPGTPILDASLPAGWVGAYNFRFDLGDIPVYFDDLILGGLATPAQPMSWGRLKALYSK